MRAFSVRMVGTNVGARIEAHNAQAAVAQVAGCHVGDVCIPIHRLDRDRFDHQAYGAECYMPTDNSGRQWLVQEVAP